MSDNKKDETPTAGLKISNGDEIYLKIWDQQQEGIRQRWNVITFFLTVSFAMFGFSLQNTSVPIAGAIQRIAALAIYWFGYLIYLRHADWSRFLAGYLRDLEVSKSTRVTLQDGWGKYEKGIRTWLSVKRLLILFGLLYAIVVALLWWLDV